ncbi:hypothetical protein GCM10027417_19400 [Glutamicibacter endophyticus]
MFQSAVRQFLLPMLLAGLFTVLAATHIVFQPVDFYVYWEAGRQAFSTPDIYAHDLVQDPDSGAGLPFVYTPFTMLLLVPFGWLPQGIAWFIWSVLVIWALSRIIAVLAPQLSFARRQILLVVLCATSIIAQHLIFGQINILLAALCIVDLARAEGQGPRWIPRGLLTGIAAGIKLTPGFFLLYLLLTRQFKAAGWMVVGGLGTIALGALCFPRSTWTYFTSELLGLSGKVDLGDRFATSGNNSISGLLAFWAPQTPDALRYGLIGIWAVLALVAARWVYRRGARLESILLIGAAIQPISPVSWIHHWVFVVALVIYLLIRKQTRGWGIAGLVFLLLQPTDLGDWLLGVAPAPLAFVFRQGLFVATVALSAVLIRHIYRTTKHQNAELAPKS